MYDFPMRQEWMDHSGYTGREGGHCGPLLTAYELAFKIAWVRSDFILSTRSQVIQDVMPIDVPIRKTRGLAPLCSLQHCNFCSMLSGPKTVQVPELWKTRAI